MRVLVLISLVAAALAVGFIVYSQTRGESVSERAAREVGSIDCVKEDGLPGVAAGKMYSTIGTLGSPVVFGGRVYHPGEKMYIGYCDANGKLLH